MRRLEISAGFVLLIAALYFFDESGLLAAMLPAVAVHEAGHLLALAAQGAGVRRIHADVSGLRIEYYGLLGTPGEVAAALMGPLFGFIYAFAASYIGRRFSSDFMLFSAGISLVLTAFNLLPALPMDGGRVCYIILNAAAGEAAAKRAMGVVGTLVAACLVALGIWLAKLGMGFALIPAGAWIYVLGRKSLENMPAMI